MIKYTADYIFTGNGSPLEDHVVICKDDGTIEAIEHIEGHDKGSIKHVRGAITPGFINTHCHLELSHMKGLVDTGLGLLPFLNSVVTYRDFPMEQILDCISAADKEMQDAGIVAVGDISNKTDTQAVKSESPIRYYTFVEMFDFMQSSLTQSTIDKYVEVFDGFDEHPKNRKCFVPHAPYTVSEGVYEHIRNENYQEDTISIHNQETIDENLLFIDKSGAFLDFYDGFGFNLDKFQATGKTSIHHAMKYLNANQKTLFVHNTLTTKADIQAAHDWSNKVYWATCANANLYIENKLPKYQLFIDEGARMTIGTDSLTSNWQLSILEELKTIKKYNSFIPLATLIEWACANGAEALGFDNELGTIQVGKKPGLLHFELSKTENDFDISTSKVVRLI